MAHPEDAWRVVSGGCEVAAWQCECVRRSFGGSLITCRSCPSFFYFPAACAWGDKPLCDAQNRRCAYQVEKALILCETLSLREAFPMFGFVRMHRSANGDCPRHRLRCMYAAAVPKGLRFAACTDLFGTSPVRCSHGREAFGGFRDSRASAYMTGWSSLV